MQRDRPLGAAVRVVARHVAVAVAALTVFGLVTVGVVVVALYPDPPTQQADIHQAVAPLPGADTATAASEHGYSDTLIAIVVAGWAVKVAYDAYQAYRYPELQRR